MTTADLQHCRHCRRATEHRDAGYSGTGPRSVRLLRCAECGNRILASEAARVEVEVNEEPESIPAS